MKNPVEKFKNYKEQYPALFENMIDISIFQSINEGEM